MKNNRKFSIRDVLIICFSIIALAVLVFILVSAGKSQKETEQKLATISKSGITASQTEDSGIVCNEVNAGGWIELYDSADEETDLTGAVLKLNGKEIYTFKDGTIIKKGQLLVADSGTALQQEDSNIISLYLQDGTQIFAFMFPKISEGQSYGRIADGEKETGLLSATEGKTNNSAKETAVQELTFSVPSGFYDEAFGLKLSAPDGYKIYYTTDGTAPTTSSSLYAGAIAIQNKSGSSYVYSREAFGYSKTQGYMPTSVDMGTVVRAIMVDANGDVKEEKEQTYYVSLAQKSDYQNVPVISIVTDGSNLFDYASGIYMSGRSHEDSLVKGEDGTKSGNYYNGWKKDAQIDFFEDGKALTYQGDASLQMLIDGSITLQQKSFTTKLSVLPSEGSSLSEYVSSEKGTLDISTYGADNTYKTREYIISQLLSGRAVGTADLTPCIVFINGEYWGDYMLKKPYDAAYIEEHYGISGEKLQFAAAAGYNEDFKSLYDFVTKNDMSDTKNYAQVESRMDMQSFLDYICTNMYISNAGFSIYHGTAWRTTDKGTGKYEDGKWRWLMGDVADTMNNTGSDGVTTYTADSFLMETFAKEPFIQSLLMNKNFCQALSDTMSQLATDTFLTDKTDPVITKASKQIQKLAVNTDDRFYGNITKNGYDSEMENISDFFANRVNYILGYTKEIAEAGGSKAAIAGSSASTDASNGASETSSEGSSQKSDAKENSRTASTGSTSDAARSGDSR